MKHTTAEKIKTIIRNKPQQFKIFDNVHPIHNLIRIPLIFRDIRFIINRELIELLTIHAK